MELYINHDEKIINVFIPVTVKALVNELMEMGERYADYKIHTVTARSRTTNEVDHERRR